MSNARLTQYESLLLDKDRLAFDKSIAINLIPYYWTVTLRTPYMTAWRFWMSFRVADCRPSWMLVKDANLYTNGNNFVCEEIRYTGAAVVMGQKEVTWSQVAHWPKERNNNLNSSVEMGQGKQNGTFTQTTNTPSPLLMITDKYTKRTINLRRKNIMKRGSSNCWKSCGHSSLVGT